MPPTPLLLFTLNSSVFGPGLSATAARSTSGSRPRSSFLLITLAALTQTCSPSSLPVVSQPEPGAADGYVADRYTALLSGISSDCLPLGSVTIRGFHSIDFPFTLKGANGPAGDCSGAKTASNDCLPAGAGSASVFMYCVITPGSRSLERSAVAFGAGTR